MEDILHKLNLLRTLTGLACVISLAACAAPAAQPTAAVEPPTAAPTSLPATATPEPTVTAQPSATLQPTAAPTAELSPTPDERLKPRDWAAWAVIPTVSATAREIYERGIANGNDAHVFSVVGDCQSEPNVFLGIYETNRNPISSDAADLLETIEYYRGSFSRTSLAVRDGLSAPSALTAMWADPESCEPNENPVQCELRVRKPAIMFVNLGTNWKPGASAEAYEGYLRQIIDLIIANGTLPILSTKADNVELDHSINAATARVAYDYDIPLWNFWSAANHLPNHGLDADRENVYLTPDGWDVRNYTGLKTLDAVRRALQ
jgi:hypothetical protein